MFGYNTSFIFVHFHFNCMDWSIMYGLVDQVNNDWSIISTKVDQIDYFEEDFQKCYRLVSSSTTLINYEKSCVCQYFTQFLNHGQLD